MSFYTFVHAIVSALPVLERKRHCNADQAEIVFDEM